jgi:hypothetical protein
MEESEIVEESDHQLLSVARGKPPMECHVPANLFRINGLKTVFFMALKTCRPITRLDPTDAQQEVRSFIA